MPPSNHPGWEESRERVNEELKRLATGLHDVRNAMNAQALQNVKQFADQTVELSDKIGAMKDALSGQIGRISADLIGLKTKAAVWGSIAGAVGMALLKWVLK